MQLLEIHDISLKASVSTSGPGDVLTRFNRLSRDFGTLQEMMSQFQADFKELASDVRHVEGQLGKIVELNDELRDVQIDCNNLRSSQKEASERMQEVEFEVGELLEETTRIDAKLTRFEVDHPPAAFLFEKRADCIEQAGAYTNALMREHQARLDAEAGGADSSAQKEEKGWMVQLPEGQHTVPDIKDREKDASDQPKAIRVSPGFEATLFEFSNLGGETRHLYEGDHLLEDFPKIGAIRLQRLRRSEKNIEMDVEVLRKDFEARERAFGDLRKDLIHEFDSRGKDSANKLLSSIMDLEMRTEKLEDHSKICRADIEQLRTSKADKGENKDLPEQVKHLNQNMKVLEGSVAEAVKSLADKADASTVLDKVTRQEIQEFVDAIQRLLQIGGPYAYTGGRSVTHAKSPADARGFSKLTAQQQGILVPQSLTILAVPGRLMHMF